MLFRKFKYYLLKLNPLKNKRALFALLLIVLCFSLIPTDSKAIFGVGDVGLFDLATMQLDALDFVESVILRMVVFVGVLVVESMLFLVTSANVLQWAVDLPISLDNNLVSLGWGFIRDLTNLFFILAMVFISMAFILKTETFGMKKALPALIVAALLVNFSLLLVKGVADIAEIFQNTLRTAFGGDFINLAMEPLRANAVLLKAWFFAIPIAILTSALIPYANVFAFVTVGFLVLNDIFVSDGAIFLKTFLLIGLNFIVGGIFFFYSALFLLRIVFIWILAIFAPLAFFASIFPSTKKYWSQWIHALLSWALLGIVAFFLIGLGLKLFAVTGDNAILDWSKGETDTGDGNLPSFIYNYLFLIIYLGAAFFVSKKFVPMGADMVIKQGEALMGRGVKAFTKTRTAGQMAEGIAGAERWGKGAEKEALRLEEKGKRGRASFVRWAGRRAQTVGPWVSSATKPIRPALINYAAGVRKNPLPNNWKQMTIDDKAAAIMASRRDEDKMVRIHAMGEEGTLQKAPQLHDLATRLQEKFQNDPHFLKERSDLTDILTNKTTASIKINLEVGKDAQDKMKKKIDEKAGELSVNIKMKPIIDDEAKRLVAQKLFRNTPEAQASAARNVAARYIHYTGLKSGDMKNQTKNSIESAIFGTSLRDMSPQHIQAIQDNFETETTNKALDNAFGEMFKGKNDEEARKIIDDYYSPRDSSGEINKPLSLAHKKMGQWATGNIIGRAFNLPFRDHMTDINDQPTSNPSAFGRRMDILQMIEEHPSSERVALSGAFNLSKKIKATETKMQQALKETPELERWNEWDRSQLELKGLGKNRGVLWGKMMTAAKARRNTEALSLSGQIKEIDKKRRETGEKMRQLKGQFKKTPGLEALYNEIKKAKEELELGHDEFERFKKTEINPSPVLKSSWDKIERLQAVKTRETDMLL